MGSTRCDPLHIGEEGGGGLNNSQVSDLSSRAYSSAISELGNTGTDLKWGVSFEMSKVEMPDNCT